jgi:hypothetical protein
MAIDPITAIIAPTIVVGGISRNAPPIMKPRRETFASGFPFNGGLECAGFLPRRQLDQA